MKHTSVQLHLLYDIIEDILSISADEIAEIKEKRCAMIGQLSPCLRLLISDEKSNSLPDSEDEREKEIQLFALQVRDELRAYFKRRNCPNWNEKSVQGWREVIPFMKDHATRDCKSMSGYLNLMSRVYPILWEVYCNEYSLPASTAAVERSFSIQGYMMTARRNRLMPSTIRNMMIVRMNCILSEKNGWSADLDKHIMQKTCIEKMKL